ncbi:MAG: GNAT family N-acetyltransferase [Lachnospiraceae bacterium]|nr:GNAT family N-acetyltransferase [Lachnospiraceae bacterium]
MKVTPITKENLEFYRGFISKTDREFIEGDYRILPLGLVADDLEGGKPMAAGALCIRPDEYELKISSFYVAPAYRGRGAGRFLLDEARRLFFLDEETGFDTEFLVYGEEEEALAGFLEHYGFTSADPEYDVYMIRVEDIKNTQIYGKTGKGVPFSEADPGKLKHLTRSAERLGAILPHGGLDSQDIDREVSVLLVTDNQLEGFAVIEKLTDRTLLLSAVYARDNEPAVLLALLEKAAALVTEKYEGDTRLLIQTVEKRGERIINYIFETPDNISYRYIFA